MPTQALEGTGAQILFSQTAWQADLIRLTLPERKRDVLDTTHLRSYPTRTKKPTRLIDPGTVVAEFDHNPAAPSLLKRPPETVTIRYPLRPGLATPDQLTFTAFAIAEVIAPFEAGKRLTTTITLALTSDLTTTPGQTPITNRAVRPVLEQVYAETNGTFSAVWGWLNENNVPISIPPGPNNGYHPAPTDRGQPTIFTPGRQIRKFETNYLGGLLVWFLKGPDGLGRTSTASSTVAVPRP